MARTAYDSFWWDRLSGAQSRGRDPDFGGNYGDYGIEPDPQPSADPQAARDQSDREVIEKVWAGLNARPQPAAQPEFEEPPAPEPVREGKKPKAKPQGAGLAEPSVVPPAAGLNGRPVTLPASRDALAGKDLDKLLADEKIPLIGTKKKPISAKEKKKRAQELFDLTIWDKLQGRTKEAIKTRDAMVEATGKRDDVFAAGRAIDTKASQDRAPHLKLATELTAKREAAEKGIGPALTEQERKDLAAAETAITKIDKAQADERSALLADDPQLRLYNETRQGWADQNYDTTQKFRRLGRNSAKIGIGALIGAVGTGVTVYAMDALMGDDTPEGEAARKALFEVDQTGVMTPEQETAIRAVLPPEMVDGILQDATPAEGPEALGMDGGDLLQFSPDVMPPGGMTFGDPLSAGSGLLPPGIGVDDAPIPAPMGINPDDRPIPVPMGMSADDAPIPVPTMTYGPTSLLAEGDFMPPVPPPPEETLPRTLPPSLVDRPDIRAELDRLAEAGDWEGYNKLFSDVATENEINRLGSNVDANWSEAVTSDYPDLNRYIDMAGTNARRTDLGLPPSVDMVPETFGTRLWDNAAALQDATVQRGYEFLSDPIYNAWDEMIAANENPVAQWVNERDPRLRAAASGALSAMNPFNMLDYAFAPTEERAMQPYRAARDFGTMMEALGLGALVGGGDEGPGAEYPAGRPEFLPTLDAKGKPVVDLAAEFADQGRTATGGTGVSQDLPPTFAELQQLERIGVLGVNPDGSNMTAAQYAAKYRVGSQLEGGLPSIGPIPDSALLGDSRRDPRPKPQLPPMAGLRPEFPGSMPAAPPLPGGARPELAPGGMPAAPPSFFGDTKPEFPGAMPAAPVGQRTLDNLPLDYPLTWSDVEAMGQDGGLGLNPDGSPISAQQAATQGLLNGRNIDTSAMVAPEQPGGGDFLTGIGTALGFGAAYAGTPEEQQARDDAITPLIETAEVQNPPGSWRGGLSDWASGLFSMGTDVGTAPDATIPPAYEPPLDVGATEPAVAAPEAEVPTTPGGRPAPGAVGDLNTSRERGDAGLAEDAAAAEEELNWINRMMRDKLGMTDASQRNKAAEALISFGSSVLASKGDDWQAIGEGLQAGLGTVTQINDEEAASLAAAQEAALEDSRWRAEFALKELQANRGGADGPPSKIEEIMMLTDILLQENPSLTWAEASAMARDQAYKSDPLDAIIAENARRAVEAEAARRAAEGS